MKPIPAIVESATSQVEAAVRAAFSSYREAEAQLAKIERKAEAARGAMSMRRLELGRALIEARKAWPARGPRAKGWGEFLAREGIEQSTAWRMMADAGYQEASDDDKPTPAVAPDVSCVPDERMKSAPPAPTPADDWDPAPSRPVALPRAGFTLALGEWQTALADVGVVDVLISDPPFGERTHNADIGRRADGYDAAGLRPNFSHWTPADVAAFVSAWSPRVRGWMVGLTSHDLLPAWEAAYLAAGRVPFAPVPCVITGMSVRANGDGPSSWTVYAMVARPRSSEFYSWGTLPGAYVGGRQPGAENGRGKPLWLTDALVRDYSRPNDLVCDPLAGYGGTLISALDAGRRAVGAERDHGAYDEAHRRAATPRELTETTTDQRVD